MQVHPSGENLSDGTGSVDSSRGSSPRVWSMEALVLYYASSFLNAVLDLSRIASVGADHHCVR